MWSLRFAHWRGADPVELARRYYGTPPAPAATLQIFAKTPLPGRVKTRLAAVVGDDAAVRVYRDLVLKTLATAAAARRAGVVGDVELWIAPEAAPGALAGWAAQLGIPIRTQQGADLGDRMRHALNAALARGRPALLIGTDIPGFDVAYLAQAACALQTHDAVIGPAEDGGYVLVGLARAIDAFTDVRWSTPLVLAQTRANLVRAAARWHELPALMDIDTHEDLARWQSPGAAPALHP